MSLSTVVSLVLLSLGSAWAATDGNCQSLFQLTASTPGYEFFGTALLASGLTLDPTQKFTILAPSDEAFGGLLTAYGFQSPLTADSIKANPDATRLAGYLKYYIIPGAYSAQDLVALSAKQNIKTLFDPNTDGKSVCVDPNVPDDGTIKPSDGDLKFGMSGTNVTVTDDSTTTNLATIINADMEGCEGFVHTMDNVINPCAPDVKETSSSASIRAVWAVAATVLAAMLFL